MTPKASIWEAFGHQDLKKYPQEGSKKNTQKTYAKNMPNHPKMTSQTDKGFAVRTLFFHSWSHWGAQLAPNASQRASQGAF